MGQFHHAAASLTKKFGCDSNVTHSAALCTALIVLSARWAVLIKLRIDAAHQCCKMADPAEASVRNKSRRYSFEVLPPGQLSGRRAAAIGGFRKHRGTGHYHTKTRSARSFLSG